MGKDRPDDKLVVLDILAQDSLGRRFNVEMQTTRPSRLATAFTVLQLPELLPTDRRGRGLHRPSAGVSICVLDEMLFHRAAFPRYHHSFRLGATKPSWFLPMISNFTRSSCQSSRRRVIISVVCQRQRSGCTCFAMRKWMRTSSPPC